MSELRRKKTMSYFQNEVVFTELLHRWVAWCKCVCYWRWYLFNWARIHKTSTLQLEVYNSVALSTFRVVQASPLVPQRCHCPRGTASAHLASLAAMSLPSAWKPHTAFSVHMPVLNVSYEWTHSICDLFVPAFNVFEIHPHRGARHSGSLAPDFLETFHLSQSRAPCRITDAHQWSQSTGIAHRFLGSSRSGVINHLALQTWVWTVHPGSGTRELGSGATQPRTPPWIHVWCVSSEAPVMWLNEPRAPYRCLWGRGVHVLWGRGRCWLAVGPGQGTRWAPVDALWVGRPGEPSQSTFSSGWGTPVCAKVDRVEACGGKSVFESALLPCTSTSPVQRLLYRKLPWGLNKWLSASTDYLRSPH